MAWLALVAEAVFLFVGEAVTAGFHRLRRAARPEKPSGSDTRVPAVPVGNVAQVDAYLAKLSPEARAALAMLRAQIRAAAPEAQEGFGYGLPGFYQDGPLFYYGAGKAHLALYGTVPAGFDAALAGFQRSKGAVRFTVETPLPAALVRRLVKAKIAENKARGRSKPVPPAKRATSARTSKPRAKR